MARCTRSIYIFFCCFQYANPRIYINSHTYNNINDDNNAILWFPCSKNEDSCSTVYKSTLLTAIIQTNIYTHTIIVHTSVIPCCGTVRNHCVCISYGCAMYCVVWNLACARRRTTPKEKPMLLFHPCCCIVTDIYTRTRTDVSYGRFISVHNTLNSQCVCMCHTNTHTFKHYIEHIDFEHRAEHSCFCRFDGFSRCKTFMWNHINSSICVSKITSCSESLCSIRLLSIHIFII